MTNVRPVIKSICKQHITRRCYEVTEMHPLKKIEMTIKSKTQITLAKSAHIPYNELAKQVCE